MIAVKISGYPEFQSLKLAIEFLIKEGKYTKKELIKKIRFFSNKPYQNIYYVKTKILKNKYILK